eukprot:TRINITY_DN1502_c0_g1_i2.p1 TRINITY_DN1502_c0_g1~~TRINITY_DN1502_c0_g1_i2.p1  ORF type:complete len:245 (-),score=73.34 TRINITY_DN1502_c0_g1_i2:58-792(-)
MPVVQALRSFVARVGGSNNNSNKKQDSKEKLRRTTSQSIVCTSSSAVIPFTPDFPSTSSSLASSTASRKSAPCPLVEPQSPEQYVAMCMARHITVHSKFFEAALEIDSPIIAIAMAYLVRTCETQDPSSSDTFFEALYLAWETEEDSVLGQQDIAEYFLGPYPTSSRAGVSRDQLRKERSEWRANLHKFMKGKDRLWKDLEYRTIIFHPEMERMLALLPTEHEVMTRKCTREIDDLFPPRQRAA